MTDYLLYLSHISAIISVILVFSWINNLGGLYSIDMSNQDSENYKNVFNWHPVMMILGMNFCLIEAILSYHSFDNISTFYNIRVSKLFHILWQTLGVGFVIVGLIAVFYSHNYPPYKQNLHSLHSWIGIFLLSIYFFQYLSGLYVFLKSPTSYRKKTLPYHIYLGSFILFTSAMAITTGIQEKSSLALNCSSPIDQVDSTGSYSDLPLVCKQANWLGMNVIFSVFFSSLTLTVYSLQKHNSLLTPLNV